jgi:hypothetical protein
MGEIDPTMIKVACEENMQSGLEPLSKSPQAKRAAPLIDWG